MPHHTIAFLLGVVFCIVAPVITPVALAYFLVNSLINKYQMVYVFTKRFESGGKVGAYPNQVCVIPAITS